MNTSINKESKMRKYLTAVCLMAGIVWYGAGSVEATQTPKCYENVVKDVIEKETRIKTSNDYGRTWTDYGPWTDWPGAGPVTDDGRNRGPAFHGEDNTGRDRWYRQYRYVVVGSTTVKVEVPCQTTTTSTISTTSTTTTTLPDDEETTTTRPPQTALPPPPITPPPFETTLPPTTTAPPSTVPETTETFTTEPPLCSEGQPVKDDQGKWTCVTVPPPPVDTPPPSVIPDAPPELPHTGPDHAAMTALLGGLALAGGTGLVRLARRR